MKQSSKFLKSMAVKRELAGKDLRVVGRLEFAPCFYCHAKRELKDLTKDHVVAKSKGGTNALTNLVLACRSCNGTKSDTSIDKFIHH